MATFSGQTKDSPVEQLQFTSLLSQTRKLFLDDATFYLFQNRRYYIGEAEAIKPDHRDWQQVWDRFAFAILSANVSFDSAVSALQVVRLNRGKTKYQHIRGYSHVPAKVEYLNKLPTGVETLALLRQPGENWDCYRERIWHGVAGLGLAKASFAICLCYPLESPFACVDTWVQRCFMGTTSFHTLGLRKYKQIERKISRIAKKCGVNGFLGQYALWEYARGEKTNHRVFER